MKILYFTFSCFFAAMIIFSCRSVPADPENLRQGREVWQQQTGGLAEEIRDLIESGSLASLTQALNIIQERNLGGGDFGRMMNGIITVLIRSVYPDAQIRLPALDLPLSFSYSRLITEAQRGNYIRPSEETEDFFDFILPFTAISRSTSPEILAIALNDTIRAEELRPNSVLPPYFRGLIHEISGRYAEAERAFRQAHNLSQEFYPSLIGIARIMRLTGRRTEAAALLSGMAITYPDNISIKRQLAIIHYENRDWARALPAINEILQHNSRDKDFLLMRAHILIEQGNFALANASLDTVASINSNNRLFLFLRARIQFEGNRNRDAALNYLRAILRADPNDEEALVYAARLLMDSPRPADHIEGRQYLSRLQEISDASIEVLNLGLRDAVRREDWHEAQSFLNRILLSRRTPQDLIDGYHIERGLGNNARAFSFAQELYNIDNTNNDYIAIFISALIGNGRRDEASRLIENRLSVVTIPSVKSQLFFLRSRIQTNDNAVLIDLRSSLFEDPRNIEALIAIIEVHHRRREERRVIHYLRLALAIAPDNQRVRQFEAEYAAALRR